MDLLSFWTLFTVLFICIYKTRTFDGCLCVEEFANGLQLPVEVVHANDGSNRIFVVELKGVVNVYYANGTKLPQPLIDVSAKTGYLGKVSESGLTSIAFHPNFKSNGLFYMLMSTTPNIKGIHHYSNLFEFKISATDKNKADPTYSRLLLKFEQPVYAHNADQLLFGIDNYLYVFIGDGGFQKDPKMFSQNMNKYLGKTLRIDVDSRTGNLPYGIPNDNPFNNGAYPKPEIYALGLRNPWRAGMDPGDRLTGEGRGRIILGDVGQDSVEELDLLEKGANYEWNIKEGTQSHCWQSKCLKGPGKFTGPIYSYNRSSKLGKSVIGGQFYRGCRSPKLNGIYFWGDYYSGLLFRLKENKATGSWQNKEVQMCDSKVCKHPLQSTFTGHMTSFGLDEEDEVYMTSSEGRNPYKTKGYVYRLVEPTQPGDPETCRVGPPQQPTKTKPIFQNLRKPSTNTQVSKSVEPKTRAFKESQLTKKKANSQPQAVKVKTTKPTTTTTTTTTPKPTTPITSKATTSPTPTPLQNGNLGSDGSAIESNKHQKNSAAVNGDTAGGEKVGQTENMADQTDNSDDSTVGNRNVSLPDESNGNVETKMNAILDILKKGNLNLNETLAKFLGKLLARLYYADFSSQDGDSVPQA